MQAINVADMRRYQSDNIIAVLEALGVDFMVERTPLGKVQVSVTLPSGDAMVAMGESVRDALGQVTGALALECDVDVATCEDSDEPADADRPIGFSLEAPVVFCEHFVVVGDDDASTLTAAVRFMTSDRDTMPAPALEASAE